MDGMEQRLQILPRGRLALPEARLGTFEERLLRTVEHHLPDLAELRGQRGLRVLELRDLRIMRLVARALFAEQRRKPDIRRLARLGLGGKVGHGVFEPLRQPVALGLERARLAAGEKPADQAADSEGDKGDDERGFHP